MIKRIVSQWRWFLSVVIILLVIAVIYYLGNDTFLLEGFKKILAVLGILIGSMWKFLKEIPPIIGTFLSPFLIYYVTIKYPAFKKQKQYEKKAKEIFDDSLKYINFIKNTLQDLITDHDFNHLTLLNLKGLEVLSKKGWKSFKMDDDIYYLGKKYDIINTGLEFLSFNQKYFDLCFECIKKDPQLSEYLKFNDYDRYINDKINNYDDYNGYKIHDNYFLYFCLNIYIIYNNFIPEYNKYKKTIFKNLLYISNFLRLISLINEQRELNIQYILSTEFDFTDYKDIIINELLKKPLKYDSCL